MSAPESQPTTEFDQLTVYELGYDEGVVVDVNGRPFDAEKYSRFKYGDGRAVSEYAGMIADQLLDECPDVVEDSYIAGSASKHVPTAAIAISNSLVAHLTMRGHAPAGAFRIDRSVVRDSDYSAMNASDRTDCTTNNGLALPEVTAQELRGRPALVVDDIKVTGSHEKALTEVLGSIGLKSVTFAYIASVQPEVAREYPQTEFDINHAYVQSLGELADLVRMDEFVLNARTCKFILQASPEDVINFAMDIPPNRGQHILSSMVGDGYHRMEAFKSNFRLFSTAIGVASSIPRENLVGSLSYR